MENALDVLLDHLDVNTFNRYRSSGLFAKMQFNYNSTDIQGNPIDSNGNLIVEDVNSISDITDDDFLNPTRTIRLPQLPSIVDNAIGANGKPIIIKKNILEKNRDNHTDITPDNSRDIIQNALYNTNLYGQNQKQTRPYNWILIHLADKNSAIIVEVNANKDNLEVVNWHYIKDKNIEQKKKQAIKEGGRILTLASVAGNTLNDLYDSKDNKSSDNPTANTQNSSELYRQATTPLEARLHSEETMRESIDKMADKLGVTPEYVYNERNTIDKGWYDPKTGKVVINLAAHATIEDEFYCTHKACKFWLWVNKSVDNSIFL